MGWDVDFCAQVEIAVWNQVSVYCATCLQVTQCDVFAGSILATVDLLPGSNVSMQVARDASAAMASSPVSVSVSGTTYTSQLAYVRAQMLSPTTSPSMSPTIAPAPTTSPPPTTSGPTHLPTSSPTTIPTPAPTRVPFQAPAVGIRANYNGTFIVLPEARNRNLNDFYQATLAAGSAVSQSPIPAGIDRRNATASLRIWAAGGDESPAPRTTVRVWFEGGPALADRTFQAHLHADPCGSYTGAHYKNDPSGPADAVNENWPTVNCDANSTCVGNATTLWEPTAAAIEKGLSVVIHDTPGRAFGDPGAGVPYLCADLIGPRPIPVNNSLAERETRQICRTEIIVEYSTPIRIELGPIVLGIGENGAVISLFPGTFTATAEMFLCDGRGRLLPVGGPPEVAFRGETIVDFTASAGQRRSIVIYAIDTWTPDELSPYEQNFAPIITSIEINPQTVAIGQTATITVRVPCLSLPPLLSSLQSIRIQLAISL